MKESLKSTWIWAFTNAEYHRLYSSFQGRPTSVRFEDFSCPLPSEEILGSTGNYTAAFVRLSSILEEILPVINARRLEIIYQPASVEKLSRASEKLLQWFKSLPPELQWNSNCPPEPTTSALHVNFLSVTILLNRPFATYMLKSFEGKEVGGASSGRKRLDGQTPEVSQKLCTTSGIRIAKILAAYRLHHGANKFFSTINPACLSAAMALMSDIVSAKSGEDKGEEKRWLASILETLKEITPTYPIAGRSYMVLCAIVKACRLPDVVPSSSQEAGASGPDYRLGEEHFHNQEESQVEPEEMVWNMDESLGWEFYPMLDDVHNIGLSDFYLPWPPAPPDGDWMLE
ncbi:fungal specific transcription factor domain-containing protein [Candidatus Bathyarchaeota archaeon]|nr:fungal specific transcription factor domain-containing protein [Candidatus Bathyarchaeota archaeon]